MRKSADAVQATIDFGAEAEIGAFSVPANAPHWPPFRLWLSVDGHDWHRAFFAQDEVQHYTVVLVEPRVMRFARWDRRTDA